jgi:branched-chain amino acid transport system ATP-binding protein
MLESRNVSVFYGRHQALENVSVSVAQGEIVVMLGANGAGKSTFLRAIAGQIRKTDGGSVLMDGADITRMPPHDIVGSRDCAGAEDRGIFADHRSGKPHARRTSQARAVLRTESRERVLTLLPSWPNGANGGSNHERRRARVVAIRRAMMSAPRLPDAG